VESLDLRRDLGDQRGIAASLAGLAAVLAGQVAPDGRVVLKDAGDHAGPAQRAVRLLAVVAGLLERMGCVLDIEDREPYERSVTRMQTLLGAQAFAAAWAAGQALSLEQALREVLPD
jgi:hypothetical protein